MALDGDSHHPVLRRPASDVVVERIGLPGLLLDLVAGAAGHVDQHRAIVATFVGREDVDHVFDVRTELLIARGELLPMTATLFFSQIIGPAQVFCRAWLSGRHRDDPRDQTDTLIACATRAVVAVDAGHTPGETP